MVDEGRSDEVEPGRDRPSPGPAGESRAPDPGQDPEAPEPGGDPEGLDPTGDSENPEHGTPEDLSRSDTVLETRELTVRYGRNVAIDEVSLEVPEQRITAIIGPSGCGKSTLLRAFNRMNDFVPEASTEGKILFRGEEIHGHGVDPVELRRRIGMVFQKPNPFPKTIYENVAWGPRIHGHEGDLDELVEESLRAAALWDEVKDKLGDVGLALSGGQQQRLCIARAIAMQPEVVLMDEPASALDPVSTSKIEDLLFHLKEDYTIVIVTHNMQQAARVSDFTAFLYEGRLIEFGSTDRIFTRPREQRTEDYITGKFG